MRRISAILLCMALVVTAGCSHKIDTSAEIAAVKAVLNNYVVSIEKEDMGLYSQVMAHDSDMVNFGTSEPPIVGWDALEKLIEDQNAALSGTEIEATDITVHLAPSGGAAWATSLWSFNASMGGTPLTIPARCTWVLEKRSDRWVIVHFHKSVVAT